MGVDNLEDLIATNDTSIHEKRKLKNKKKKKKKKKRAVENAVRTSQMLFRELELELNKVLADANTKRSMCTLRIQNVLPVEDDLNEPTIGEKLASLELLEDDKVKTPEIEMTSPSTKPPSADSVHVLLKQALRADDRALLLDCLHTRDEKVIANSISLLNPSDVLKLLDFLISIVQSRGAVVVCALPWLKSLLLQHASAIMSQDSSIRALNSLYQIIESRVLTFQSALQLSTVLDYLFVGIYDDMADESNTFSPTIYEDKDESDEDEPDDATETDNESDEPPPINGFSDLDVSDGMSE